MGLRAFYHALAGALACAVIGQGATAQVAPKANQIQLLFVAADPTLGVEGSLPPDLPRLGMERLPEASTAQQEVFSTILRSNPVSTFVESLNDSKGQFDQFIMVSHMTLSRAGTDLNVGIGGDTYGMSELSDRLSALLDAVNPTHRRLAFLHITDDQGVFSVSTDQFQAAIDPAGFDMVVLMIANSEDITPDQACTPDQAMALHYPLIAGFADRAPFGDQNAVSTVSEVDTFLRANLRRASLRGAGCGPKYSLILKSSDDDDQPLIEHGSAVSTSFVALETQLYHETFEALFLMESDDTPQITAYLEDCIYCPNERALRERMKTMRQQAFARRLETEIWDQISQDTDPLRLTIYLSNCTLCSFRSEAERMIELMNIKDAVKEEELAAFTSASTSRDIVALQTYAQTCVACTEKAAALDLVAEIEQDTAYQAESDAFAAAKASRTVAALQNYLRDCRICAHKSEAQDQIATEQKRADLSGPCLAAAGLPQSGGPRRLRDINQSAATRSCEAALAAFPDDPVLITYLGRIAHAAGDLDAALRAYDYGVENKVAAAFGLKAYTHYAGEGDVPFDVVAAEELARGGAAQDDWLSKELLTVLYSKDLIDGKDASHAYDIARSMADKNNALAQFFVGYFHLTGAGVPLNEEKAVSWLDKSAKNGYLNAYSFLADMHERGAGTAQAFDAAADLYWQAFTKGDPTARSRLTDQLGQRQREVVRLVQRNLQDAGAYEGPIDGIPGPSTVAAVERFLETLSEES